MMGCLVNNELEKMSKEPVNGLFLGIIPAFACRNWGKTKESSVRIGCLWNLKRKQEYYLYRHVLFQYGVLMLTWKYPVSCGNISHHQTAGESCIILVTGCNIQKVINSMILWFGVSWYGFWLVLFISFSLFEAAHTASSDPTLIPN
jgi:hypothetical protein